MKNQNIIKVNGLVHDEKTKSNTMMEFDAIRDPETPTVKLILEWSADEDSYERPHKILHLKDVGLQESGGIFLLQDPILKSWIDAALK